MEEHTNNLNQLRRKVGSLYHAVSDGLPFYIAACLTGIAAIFYRKLIEGAAEIAKGFYLQHPGYFCLTAPLFFFLAAAVVMFGAQGAGGSGIPQVMAALEVDQTSSKSVRGILGIRVLIVKVISSLCAILGGASIGREGPMIQIASCIFHAVTTRFKKFSASTHTKAWLLAGGSAGIAAAFNTPLGGIVFAIEELTSEHFFRMKSTIIAAVIVAGMTAQAISGSYMFLGMPQLGGLTDKSLLFAVIIAVLCGISGALFTEALRLGVRFRRSLSPQRKLIFAATCGIGIMALAALFGPDFMGGGSDLLQDLFFHDRKSSGSLFLSKFTATVFSFISGTAGGIFAPSLAIGGSLSTWLNQYLLLSENHLGTAIGMTAFLAAVTHAPFTAGVLVLEMVQGHESILLILFAGVISSTIARLIRSESFYHGQADFYLKQLETKPQKSHDVNAAPEKH